MPQFFKPIFKGKKIVAIEFKSIHKFDIQTIYDYLEDKGILWRLK